MYINYIELNNQW